MKSVCLALAFAAFTARAALVPADLRCDYAVDPLGVDSDHPRLFWTLPGNGRDQKQTAYQILAASSAAALSRNDGDLWDSGKVASDETVQLLYGGKKLASFEQVFWKVRVWDGRGKVSKWSPPATWTMGVLQPADWHAGWITAAETNPPSTLLRHEFTVKPGLKRALVNICGLGQYDLTLNGKKVGDYFLAPGWTEYDRTCLYDTFDVTKALSKGANAIGIELGNGMYNVIGVPERFTKFRRSFGPQKVIAQLRLEYADGSVQYVGTDDHWRALAGPITFSSIYGGEDCDARLEQNGWDRVGFDDARWPRAQSAAGPGGALRGLSCAAPPVKEFEIHHPTARWTLTNDDIVFDLGQNAAHVPQIRVAGPAGSGVQLFPSELTNADGSVNQGSMGAGHRGRIWCDYLKGTDRAETWSPKFFYVGCRYVQVHPLPSADGKTARVLSLDARVIHSASDPVGEFKCSNELFNRIYTIIRWAQQNNMVSILTDCPHRERLGWLEQDHLNGPALRYDFDLSQLFTKTLNDIADSQLTNGVVPTTAPEYAIFRNKNDVEHLRNDFGDSPEWSSSFILIPWQQYEFDGDLDLFRLHYQAMTDYLAYCGTRATNGIAAYGLGDWYDLGPRKPGVSQLTPIALTATAFYFEDAKTLARAAALLGKEADAKQFSDLAERIRAAFNEKFYDPTNHFYATDSQCANAIPLVFGICEPTNRAAVLAAIVADVRAHGNGLTAGDVGYRYLLRALSDGGRDDVIFEMNDQTDKPGYGMQVKKGKTSLTEAWDGGSSQDHFMLGQIQEWFFHDVAGIQNAPGSAGFKEIIIAPHPVGDLKSAEARYDSIRGPIVSRWKREGRSFSLAISIPANTSATVSVPAPANSRVEADSDLARLVGNKNGRSIYAVPSGDYCFRVTSP